MGKGREDGWHQARLIFCDPAGSETLPSFFDRKARRFFSRAIVAIGRSKFKVANSRDRNVTAVRSVGTKSRSYRAFSVTSLSQK
jgi:hypothetical protein